jgi:hypothetical protein
MREDQVVPTIQRDQAVGGSKVHASLPFLGRHAIADVFDGYC